MLDVLLGLSFLTAVFVGLTRSLGASVQLNSVNRESALALDAARSQLERIQGEAEFAELFVRYDTDPLNDPLGAGTAPGGRFAVAGLDPAPNDLDGFAGEIVLPTALGPGGLELRENLDLPALGLPRDLNGDGSIDGGDRAADYVLLPVLARVRWRGATGVRQVELVTLVADR